MKNCKVLVVHDDSDVREILVDLLSAESFPVESEPNGLAAMRRVQAGYQPDVVITDLMMPEMDGYQLVRELKRHAAWASIPLLVLTSATPPPQSLEHVEAILQAPVDLEELLGQVKAACRKKAANA